MPKMRPNKGAEARAAAAEAVAGAPGRNPAAQEWDDDADEDAASSPPPRRRELHPAGSARRASFESPAALGIGRAAYSAHKEARLHQAEGGSWFTGLVHNFAAMIGIEAPVEVALPIPSPPGRQYQRAEGAADSAAVSTLVFLRSAAAAVDAVATQAYAHTGWAGLKMAIKLVFALGIVVGLHLASPLVPFGVHIATAALMTAGLGVSQHMIARSLTKVNKTEDLISARGRWARPRLSDSPRIVCEVSWVEVGMS